MDLTKFSEKLMSMDETSWQRHANPWSVYTRFLSLPLLSLACFSREWFGYYSVIAVVLALAWIWLNPRLFNPPKTTYNWASMGTFGERVYLNRKATPIPLHHQRPLLVLQLLSLMGLPVFIYGLYKLNIWVLVFANLWIIVFKAWFVDRMVWLFLEMKDQQPSYLAWLKT